MCFGILINTVDLKYLLIEIDGVQTEGQHAVDRELQHGFDYANYGGKLHSYRYRSIVNIWDNLITSRGEMNNNQFIYYRFQRISIR